MKDRNQEEGGEMEKVVKVTFMVTENQAERLSRCQQKTGLNCSELMRFFIDHSIPFAEAYPSLVHILPTIPVKEHGKPA